ncbi:MAG: hypothetical protein AAF366_18620 [Pseudomonadota bacterium]
MGRESNRTTIYVRLGQAMAALMISLGAGQVGLAHMAAADLGGVEALFPPDLPLDRLVADGFVAMAVGTFFGLLTEVSRMVGWLRSGDE